MISVQKVFLDCKIILKDYLLYINGVYALHDLIVYVPAKTRFMSAIVSKT